jgi:hypothetical protein
MAVCTDYLKMKLVRNTGDGLLFLMLAITNGIVFAIAAQKKVLPELLCATKHRFPADAIKMKKLLIGIENMVKPWLAVKPLNTKHG